MFMFPKENLQINIILIVIIWITIFFNYFGFFIFLKIRLYVLNLCF